MSRTVPSPSGQSTLMHSSSSGARSRMEWRGPLPRWGDALCSIIWRALLPGSGQTRRARTRSLRCYLVNRFVAGFSARRLSHDDAPTARSIPARGNAPGTCPSPCYALQGRRIPPPLQGGSIHTETQGVALGLRPAALSAPESKLRKSEFTSLETWPLVRRLLILRTQALQWRRLGGSILRRFFRAAEKIDTQETALEGTAKRRPVALAFIGSKRGADRSHLGIQIVEVVQHQRLTEHGKFWRTKRVLPVMADEHVQHERLQIGRKSIEGVNFSGDAFIFNQNVTQQLAFVGVTERALVAQFLKLSHIMEHGASQQQVGIRLRILRKNRPAQAAQADHVFKQAAKIRVMHHLSRRGAFKARDNFRVGYDGIQKAPQPGIFHGGAEGTEFCVKLVHIFRSVSEEIGRVHFAFFRAADLVDGNLELAAVAFDAGLHLHEIVPLEGGRVALEAVPHASFDGAGAVTQFQAEVGFPLARGTNFFFANKKIGGDRLFGLQGGDEGLFHVPDFFLGMSNNFRPDFFLSSLSGVTATSSMGWLVTAAESV